MKDVHCRRQSPFVCKCTENIVELIQFVSILQSLNFSITSSVLNIKSSVSRILIGATFLLFHKRYLQNYDGKGKGR